LDLQEVESGEASDYGLQMDDVARYEQLAGAKVQFLGYLDEAVFEGSVHDLLLPFYILLQPEIDFGHRENDDFRQKSTQVLHYP